MSKRKICKIPHTIQRGAIGISRSLANVSTTAARGKATEVGETLQQLQEFQSRAESDHRGEAKSRGRRASDPRDPKASLLPGRAPPGQERADVGCSRPPRLTFRQRVQHPRLLQVPPELLALRVGGLRRHGGSGTGARGRSRKTARPAAGPKPCTRTNSHPAPPARPEPRRAPLTL